MLHPFLQGRSRIITHITAWTLVAFLLFIAISGVSTAWESFQRTTINLLFLIILFYLNARVFIDRYFEKRQYGKLVLISVSVIFAAAALRTWIEMKVMGGSLFLGKANVPHPELKMFSAYFISFVLLMFFSTMYQLVENRNKLVLQHTLLEARHHEAQLNFLKAQINPHFLFNTLNNIYAAATVKHPRTPDMVLRLSELLRYVTYDGQHDKINLTKEITQIRGYMDLFDWKSPAPLPVTLDVQGDTASVTIEPMLLLPLVENAYKHSNVEDENATGAFIEMTLNVQENSNLLFRVRNSFDANNHQKDEVGGVGLENVKRRLELHYPGKSHLQISKKDDIFEVSLSLKTI